MKIVSSFMDEINLVEKNCHTIFFRSSKLQMEFRQLLDNLLKNRKESDARYLTLVDNDLKTIKRTDLYPILFEGNIINLQFEKSTEKAIKEFIEYQLENNPELLHYFIKFSRQIEEFLFNLEIESDGFLVDFTMTDKTISQLIKSLNFTITTENGEFVSNNNLRILLIKLFLKLNHQNKKELLIVTYPEADAGSDDYVSLVNDLQGLNVTTLVLTSNYKVLSAVPIDNVFMVDSKGEIYDVKSLKSELKAFNLVDEQNLDNAAIRLSYIDFMGEYDFLSKNYKDFLLSDRF